MQVLIALPNALVAEGLAQVVREVAPRAGILMAQKKELLARAADGGPPDVVLALYPWISLATLRTLSRRHPSVATVAVVEDLATATQRRLLEAGAAAIVPATSAPAIFAAVLRLVVDGDVCVQGRALRDDAHVAPIAPRTRVYGLNLTPRQLDVLGLVARGRTNASIAGDLGIGVRTVKGHVAVILRALHADNRGDAGRRARRWLAGTGPRQRKLRIG